MLAGVISAFIFFALFMISHLVLFHLKQVQDRSKTIFNLFTGSLIGHSVAIIFLNIAYPDFLILVSSGVSLSVVAGFLLLACMFVMYMPFYYTIHTSLSVETLAMLVSKGDGQLPLSELKNRFTSEKFLLDRLDTMCRNGYLLRSREGIYTLLPRGRKTAQFMLRVKNFLRLGSGG